MLHALREGGYEGQVALTAHSSRDAHRLKEAGADLVLLPFVDAAERAAEAICAGWEESPAQHPILIYEGGTYVQEDEDSDRL